MVQQHDPSPLPLQAPEPVGSEQALQFAWGLVPGSPTGDAALRALDRFAPTPLARGAALDRLRAGVAWMHRWDAAWAREVPVDLDLDAACGAAWASLFSNTPFGALGYVKEHLVGEAERVFRSVMASVDLPEHERRRVRRELREGFFFALITREGGVPAWMDLAFRVLEVGPLGPVQALSALVPPTSWVTAARCLARRRAWRDTAQALWPGERGAPQRSRRLQRLLGHGSGRFPELFHLHLWTLVCKNPDLRGLADAPREQGPLALLRGRARIRARLRALLTEAPGEALVRLLALPALHRRTQAATRRLAWAWARRELETGFSLGFSAARLPRCPILPSRPCPPEMEGALDAWVLLVALRGHMDALIRWLEEGTAQNHSGAWGRLFSKDLPPRLRGMRADQRSLLRDWIGPDPLVRLVRHRELLVALAALPLDRRLRKRARALLLADWHPDIPLPDRDFPVLTRHAAQIVARLRSTAPEVP